MKIKTAIQLTELETMSVIREELEAFKAGKLKAEELWEAQLGLGEITGEFGSDDLLGKIFSSFCIGK